MRLWRLLGLLTLAFAVACSSTAYRKNQGRSGGYHDQRIDDTTFVVKFYGNHSNDLKTRNHLLLRCAVLTAENGYGYFNAIGPIDGDSNQMDVMISLTNDPGPASYDVAIVKAQFANLVNCGKAKRPVVQVDLPGLGQPCQPGLATSSDLAESNTTYSPGRAERTGK